MHPRFGQGLVGDGDGVRVVPGVAGQGQLATGEPAGDDSAGTGQVVGGQQAQLQVAITAQPRHDVPFECVGPLEALHGSSGLASRQVVWSWPPGPGHGACHEPELDGVVVGDEQETPLIIGLAIGDRTCSAWYSTPGRRPPSERGTRSAPVGSTYQLSPVSRLPLSTHDRLLASAAAER